MVDTTTSGFFTVNEPNFPGLRLQVKLDEFLSCDGTGEEP